MMNLRELKRTVEARGGDPSTVDIVFSSIRGTVESGYRIDIGGFGSFFRNSGGGLDFKPHVAAPRIAEFGRGKHPCRTCAIVGPEERGVTNPTCAGCKLPREYAEAIESDGIRSAPGGGGESVCHTAHGSAHHAVREYRINKERMGCAA